MFASTCRRESAQVAIIAVARELAGVIWDTSALAVMGPIPRIYAILRLASLA